MKNTILIILAILLIGGGAFYGGMLYNGKKTNSGQPGNFRNGGPNFTGQSNGQKGGNQLGGNMTNGEIIAKDDKSITVKLRDGGSKIVFYSTSTQVSKMATGNLDDLQVGTSIMISGDTNTDGSLTAKTVSIRPADSNSNPEGNNPPTPPQQ